MVVKIESKIQHSNRYAKNYDPRCSNANLSHLRRGRNNWEEDQATSNQEIIKI